MNFLQNYIQNKRNCKIWNAMLKETIWGFYYYFLSSKKQFEVFTNFFYVCSREFGSKPFHVTVPNSHQGYNEYSLKKPPANGYFFVFLFGPLCTWDMFHDTTMKKNGLNRQDRQWCGFSTHAAGAACVDFWNFQHG